MKTRIENKTSAAENKTMHHQQKNNPFDLEDNLFLAFSWLKADLFYQRTCYQGLNHTRRQCRMKCLNASCKLKFPSTLVVFIISVLPPKFQHIIIISCRKQSSQKLKLYHKSRFNLNLIFVFLVLRALFFGLIIKKTSVPHWSDIMIQNSSWSRRLQYT